MHSAEMLAYLEAGDVEGCRRLWDHVAPHLPQASYEDSEAAMHHARTQTRSIAFKLRAYSHRWLTERSYPSGLPDALRPKAERLYPRIVDAVGIACLARSELYKPIVLLVRGAMEDAVRDCYANGDNDPSIVRPRMMEAKADTVRKLLGIR